MEVVLLMAVTLDGKISRDSTHPVNWTGKADKLYFSQQTKAAGIIVMGLHTYQTIGKPLADRMNVVMTRNPEYLSITPTNELEFTNKSPQDILIDLSKRGFSNIILIGGSQVNTAFLKENLIDKIYVVVVPKLFGIGLPLFTEECDKNLYLQHTRCLGEGHVLLTYSVIK